MAVKTIVLRVRDFEHMLAVRQRVLSWLHSHGVEPAFRDDGNKLIVDYGEEMFPQDAFELGERLYRHLGIKGH